MEISKRDLFAAHALAGLLARPPGEIKELPSHEFAAREAYRYADAMMHVPESPRKSEPAESFKKAH